MSDMAGFTLSLLLLLVLVALALWLAWRKRLPGARFATGEVRVLEVVPVGPTDRLVLVGHAGQRYLLAQGSGGLTMLVAPPAAPAFAPSGDGSAASKTMPAPESSLP
jgi:flagellar biogenesis protein FliO